LTLIFLEASLPDTSAESNTMSQPTVTRADLAEAVYQEVGL